jgi:predicted RNA methylase
MSAAWLEVLAGATFEGNAVRLPAVKLDPAVYAVVNDALERLGGKWKRGGRPHPDGTPKGTHVFPYDPQPLLAAVLAAGEMPPKNPTAFFPTPAPVVSRMVEIAELADGLTILEPSAGAGAIAAAVLRACRPAVLDLVELLSINAARLRAQGFDPHEADFTQWTAPRRYDRVLMNPPFSVEGDKLAYITHIERAFGVLADGGLLVAIAPTGFTYRSDRRSAAFRESVTEYGGWEELPRDAFKDSGTNVSTAVLWMGCGAADVQRPARGVASAAAPAVPVAREYDDPRVIVQRLLTAERKIARSFRDLQRMLTDCMGPLPMAQQPLAVDHPDLFAAGGGRS